LTKQREQHEDEKRQLNVTNATLEYEIAKNALTHMEKENKLRDDQEKLREQRSYESRSNLKNNQKLNATR